MAIRVKIILDNLIIIVVGLSETLQAVSIESSLISIRTQVLRWPKPKYWKEDDAEKNKPYCKAFILSKTFWKHIIGPDKEDIVNNGDEQEDQPPARFSNDL